MGGDDDDDDDDNEDSSDEAAGSLPKPVQRILDHAARRRKKVSRVKLFDAAVTTELKNLRSSKVHQVHPMARKIVEDTRAAYDKKPHSASLLASLESSKSWLKIGAEFRKDRDSDFQRAVERLARAEASCHFDGAVRAAEAAAAKAPPELREEAALEGARNYQAMIMDSFQGKLPGPKPVEVLGYIGITGPK
ncbi:uncharacterized protein [Anabrus simplex]|uniref:uncharacterized protein n=1 Tax=Anabrus simplex TaxID=316456 RepID=UPI0035A38EA9